MFSYFGFGNVFRIYSYKSIDILSVRLDCCKNYYKQSDDNNSISFDIGFIRLIDIGKNIYPRRSWADF